MRIVVIGTRGIPNIQGGVETHCEKLYPLLTRMGCEIILIRRSCYISSTDNLIKYEGVRLKNIYAPRKKSIEAIIHTFLAICYARKLKADILHIHAIGPAILIPFAKFLGLKVVVTHHSLNYEHNKWGSLAKYMLRKGEMYTAKYSDKVICISKTIYEILREKYKRKRGTFLIYNGVDRPSYTSDIGYLKSLKLDKVKYIFAIGRLVEDKGFHNLIEAYVNSRIKDDFKLVIAGDSDHETEYSIYLKKLAKENNVILTGFIKGKALAELFSHAALFVLPSFHEGLPISLLEAMSYNLDVLVSSIPANLEIGLQDEDYFNPNNNDELSRKLELKMTINNKTERKYDLTSYDWEKIAKQTYDVYKSIIK